MKNHFRTSLTIIRYFTRLNPVKNNPKGTLEMDATTRTFSSASTHHEQDVGHGLDHAVHQNPRFFYYRQTPLFTTYKYDTSIDANIHRTPI